jgi:hypothetical protein
MMSGSSFIAFRGPFGRAVCHAGGGSASCGLLPVAPSGLRREPHILPYPFGRCRCWARRPHALRDQAILRYLDRVLPTPPLTPDEAKPPPGWTGR